MDNIFLVHCKKGNYDKVKDLLNRGIDPTIQRNRALIYSVLNKHDNIINLLLCNKEVLQKLTLDQIKFLNEQIDNPLIKYLRKKRIIFYQLKEYIEDDIKDNNSEKDVLKVIKYLLDNRIALD